MKTLFLAFALALSFAASAFAAPGTVDFFNTPFTPIVTNATAIGGGIGRTSPALGGFIYGLFTAPYGTGQANPDLISGPWTFTGLYATNTAFAAGGRLNGGSPATVPTGWDAGVTNDFKLAGWSSNLGQTWATVELQLATGFWADYSGFYGESGIGFGMAGGDTGSGPPPPPFALFGSGPNGQGNPLSSGFTLYSVVPEPSSFALAGLATAILLGRGRKENRLA